MSQEVIRGFVQKGETTVTDLLVVKLLRGPGSQCAIRAAVRAPQGDFTMRSWPFAAGALRLALVDEISASVDQLVQDVLIGIIGAQETLDGR